MEHTFKPSGKVNEIALQVRKELSAKKEDHTKTTQLLEELQAAIQEVQTHEKC